MKRILFLALGLVLALGLGLAAYQLNVGGKSRSTSAVSAKPPTATVVPAKPAENTAEKDAIGSLKIR